MATPQIIFEISDKNELFRIHGVNGNRRTPIARLEPDTKTIYWKDDEMRDAYHKSVDAFLSVERMVIENTLIEGQLLDKRPASAPARPTHHKMPGDLTPAYLDDLLKYEPIKFENTLGVVLKADVDRNKRSANVRDDWMRANVARTISGPTAESRGGVHESVRFTAENQIIARRQSHLTFTLKEIYRPGPTDADGNATEITAEPFFDPYGEIAKRVKDPGAYDIKGVGKIEVLWKRHAAASAGNAF